MPKNRNATELFLSDVDGSLITPDHRVTERTLRAIAALRAGEIQFTIVSGRPPKGMLKLVSELGLTLPLAAFNGGMIVCPDLSVIEEHRLEPKITAKIIATIEAQGAIAWLYRGMDWLLRDGSTARVRHEVRNVGFEPTVVDGFDSGLDAVKIVAVSDDPVQMARCEDEIHADFGNLISAELSQTYFLDVTHPKANKGEVVRSLSRILSIPAEHFATLGDMANDISMFKESGLSIAMGNASGEVNAAADFETKRNDDEGFAYAVEVIILPQK